MDEYRKPLPVITPLNRPFWEAAKGGELRLQRCLECGQVWFPIGPVCPDCWSERFEWAPMSGRGKLSNWVIYHQAFHDAYREEVPYNVAEVELEEGPRLMTNIVGVKNEELFYGLPVEVYFDSVTPEVTLVKFRKAA